ncbi:DUF3284 domain-containing protein [Catellicoccus marimammalium]|uniref:DUF3284 domain-containing protein n=1 Tax=Catellicoccus marimammalium M35/04/3 TaxID=1234409 RepID=K8ZPV2_9ENTE|nr:DUF3284 domain-containing protein [Catellicoccus marimammalium]EKU27571.1 hypothetical protein C683_0352 [Catellicoccus marimammalium M35/04/3]
MQVTKQINCPSSFIYNELIDSVLYDIKRTTGKKPKRSHLENFSYEKRFHDGSIGTVTITKQEDDRCYAFQTKTKNNTFYTSYEITPIDDYHCQIFVQEKVESDGFFQKINDFLMMTLFLRNKKQHLLQMLAEMEKKYQTEKIKEDNDRLKK